MQQIRPDAMGLRWLAKMGGRLFGDDQLLRRLITLIEQELSIAVIGVDQLLDLALPASDAAKAGSGYLGQHQADQTSLDDIAHSVFVFRHLGPADIGQALVVEEGMVLAVEAIEGTAAMLARAGELRRSPGQAGVLVKLMKPGQERRADLPTIGPATVEQAAAIGLAGIVIDARAMLVIDRKAVIAACDRAGLFFYALDPDHFDPSQVR